MEKESDQFDKRLTSNKKRIFHLLERARVLLDPKHFQVDPNRAHEFLYDRDRSSPKMHANLDIPIGKRDWMIYAGEILGGVSDRPISSYQTILFPDVFAETAHNRGETFTLERFLREAKPLEYPKTEYGGFQEVFKPGNVVLDIASGEAVAAIQLALKFPEVTIIGTDILYQERRKIYPNKPGLQLTHSDWLELQTIPDRIIDVILSVQGIAMWGFPNSASIPEVSEEDGFRIIRAINRVSKPGTIMRLDKNNEFLCQHLGSDWEISPRHDTFIARRKK